MNFKNFAFLTCEGKAIRLAGMWVGQDDSEEVEDARGRRASSDFREMKKKCAELNQRDEWRNKPHRHAILVAKTQEEYEGLYRQYIAAISPVLNGCGES